MDQELAALVNQFQALQHEDVAEKKINERNVVELVLTLRQRKMIDLLFTSDGKEYLTWPQLKREVVDEVVAHGGRINVCDIPAILNVDLSLIEQAVEMILSEEATITQLGGEIMTQEYIDAVLQDAQDELKEHGSLAINDFAMRHQLSLEFINKEFTRSIAAGKLVALFDEVALFTPQFVRRQTHLVRSALLGATAPVNLLEFCDRHKVLRQLFPKVLQHLADAKQLPGRVEGGAGGQYIPSVFENKRADAVTNVYTSNGVVSFTALQSHGVADPRAYMATRFNPQTTTAAAPSKKGKKGKKSASAPTAANDLVTSSEEHPLAGHTLSSCFLADRTLKQLGVEIDSLLQGEPPLLDLTEKLPTEVNMDNTIDEDIVTRRLADLNPELATSCVLVGRSMYVHSATIDGLKEQIEGVAREDYGRKGSSDLKIRPGGSQLPASARNNRKIKLLMAKALGLSSELRSGSSTYESALDELVELWEEKIASVYEEVGAAIASSGAHNIKKLRAQYQSEVVRHWNDLYVWSKGATWANQHSTLKSDGPALNKHLIGTIGAKLLQNIILDASTDNPEVHDVVAESVSTKTPKQLLSSFSKKEKESLSKIVSTSETGSVADFIDAMESLSSSGELNIPLHGLNKRLERELTGEAKKKLLAEAKGLSPSDDASANAEMFSTLCSVAVLTKCRQLLQVSGKTTGGVVAAVNAEEAVPFLAESHKLVVDMIKSSSVSAEVKECLSSLQRELCSDEE